MSAEPTTHPPAEPGARVDEIAATNSSAKRMHCLTGMVCARLATPSGAELG